MTLTPEERKRIEEEEEARAEAQEKLKKEKEAEQYKQGCLGCLGLITIFVIIGLLAGWFSSSDEPEEKDEAIRLTATVDYTDTQLFITNNDNYDWTGVTLEINPGVLRSGYVLEASVMKAGETYSVGYMQFAKPDGERLNPFTTKPQAVRIIATTPRGYGYYAAAF